MRWPLSSTNLLLVHTCAFWVSCASNSKLCGLDSKRNQMGQRQIRFVATSLLVIGFLAGYFRTEIDAQVAHLLSTEQKNQEAVPSAPTQSDAQSTTATESSARPLPARGAREGDFRQTLESVSGVQIREQQQSRRSLYQNRIAEQMRALQGEAAVESEEPEEEVEVEEFDEGEEEADAEFYPSLDPEEGNPYQALSGGMLPPRGDGRVPESFAPISPDDEIFDDTEEFEEDF